MPKSNAGRPKIVPDAAMRKKAERLASQGLTLEQIAHTLGICYQTLNEKRKEYTDFSDAIERGRAKGIAVITNSLFERAQDGDVSAIRYYLNNRDNANWKDRQTVEQATKHSVDWEEIQNIVEYLESHNVNPDTLTEH